MSNKEGKRDIENGPLGPHPSGNDHSKAKEKGSGSVFVPNGKKLKLLFCFFGLQISYILWGLVQENLMTQKYKNGSFKSSAFCVFGNRFFALFISLAIVLIRKWRNTSSNSEAPFYQYLPSSISNSVSSWAQYEALKYVSFPTQVLSKSCKIIPVMLVRFLSQRL